MEYSEEKKDSVMIVRLRGRIDSSTSAQLEEKILALLGAGEKKIIIDLGHLDFISSAGLRVLLLAAKRMKASAGKLAISSMKEHIKEVFDISGFTSIFRIFPSLDGALADVQ